MALTNAQVTRWGELPIDADTEPGIAAIEHEQITKPRPMELDGPLLHQPVISKLESTNLAMSEAPIECCFGDPLIMHTIHLNQHAKKLRSMLYTIRQKQQSDDKQCEDDNEVPFLPTLPVMELADKELTHKKSSLDRCFESKFRLGIGKAPPEINEQLAKKILRKALAVMCAHAGFETTTESILEILVDVTSEFYLKLTRLLRANVDREALVGGTNFPDVLEDAFYGVGIGSMRNLALFYRTRVIDYHSHVLQTCRNLSAKYRELKSPQDEVVAVKAPEEDTKKPLEVGLEDVMVTDEPDVPQIHFPAAAEDHLLDEENNPIEEVVTGATLEELPQLQVTFEHEGSSRIVGEDDDVCKVEQTRNSDLILQLATNGVPNLYGDDEIVNVIDSPSQVPSESGLMSGSDPHLSAMLDQPHTPGNLDMKLFKGFKKTTVSQST